ncbi:DUF2325 domain-containing protein [Megalodesulfovibrio paquesii]
MLLLDHLSPSGPVQASMSERRALWELPDLQCAVVGTCLTLQECRRLARRGGLTLPDDATDYMFHSALVRFCREESRTAKLVQKHLDRKYMRHVRQALQTLDDKERRAYWKKCVASGDIPGPFWALVTHPYLGQELFSEVFGQVHMLSHLVGASNRADIRRLQVQETKLAEVEETLATVKRAYRARIRDLAKRNRELAAEKKAPRTGGSSIAFQQLFESLRLAHEERAQALKIVESLEKRLAHTEAMLAEKGVENEVLEKELARVLEMQARQRCPREGLEPEAEGIEGPRLGCPDQIDRSLNGKCILYVGGRSGMAVHYREMVESLGGEFVHHDGGREHAISRLHQILPKADAVLCPMDCVSHEAFHCVKQACRQCMKPCLAMRSASLSSLSKTLEGLLDASRHESQGEQLS